MYVCYKKPSAIELTFFSVSRFLPSYFDLNVAYNLSIGSAGGSLIAWKRSYTLFNSWSTRHTISAVIKNTTTGVTLMVTNVYGPSKDVLKPSFIEELRRIAVGVDLPWILAGDFNLVRWLTDRSSSIRGFTLIELFNSFISDAGIVDVPLRNRAYTWSSHRPTPVFSRLDRVFLSHEWQNSYPIITLEAQDIVVSDHTLLLLTCKGLQQCKTRLRLEAFWFKYDRPRLMVQQLWGTQ